MVTIEGVPSVSPGVITVRGPIGGSSITRQIESTQTLENLPPGRYTVSASEATNGAGTYAPTVTQQQVDITASLEPVAVTIAYTIQTGSIRVDVSGLPQNLPAAVTITGPAGFHRRLSAAETAVGNQPRV